MSSLKRKKSGAQYRKERKLQKVEEEQMGQRLINYFRKDSEENTSGTKTCECVEEKSDCEENETNSTVEALLDDESRVINFNLDNSNYIGNEDQHGSDRNDNSVRYYMFIIRFVLKVNAFYLI